MGITPLRFTGISQFSQDFQVIVDRTVQIASLPARALQNDQAALLEKKNAMAELRMQAAGLAASLAALGKLGDTRAIAATSSSSKVVATLADSGVQAGSFTVSEVTSLAQRAVSTAQTGQSSATSGPVAGEGGYLQLVAGGETHALNLEPGKDNLAGVRDAINALGAGVTASLVFAGDAVFLSIAADQTGEKTIELRAVEDDPGSNLLAVTQAGSNTVFKVNGQIVTRPENFIEGVIPGVSFTLNSLTAGNETITVDLASSRAPVAAALNSFVSAYNQLAGQVLQAAAGPLRGESLLNDLQSRLRLMAGQFGEGSIRNLAEIGITFDRQGVMSFDEFALPAASTRRMEDVFDFLRSGAQGLGSLANAFEEFSDPIAGRMVAQMRSWDESDQRLQTQIAAILDKVDGTQANLLNRLQAADALLARLEGQQSMLDAVIQSLQFSMYGRRNS